MPRPRPRDSLTTSHQAIIGQSLLVSQRWHRRSYCPHADPGPSSRCSVLFMVRSRHESSQELKNFQVLSTSLMTSVYPSGYKVTGQCQHAIQSAPLLIIALPQAASHPGPSTGSKRPIYQTRQLQLNRHKGRGTGHAHLGTRWEKNILQAVCGPGLTLWDQAASLSFCGGALLSNVNSVL